MASIKGLLFLLIIARTEGGTSSNYSVGEGIMKTILESCYGQNSSANPVVIFGDFNEFIDGVSIIRINEFLNMKDYEEHGSLKFKPSSVVLRAQSITKFLSNLKLLRETKLWDNLIRFFIIDWNAAPCMNSRIILSMMWRMEILNSIYICPNFINNTPEIYTLNPIIDYAPYPWKRVAELDYFNIFHQNFDANISCTHLTYDKTNFLNGYDIVAVGWASPRQDLVPRINYFEALDGSTNPAIIALRTIIIALNASGRIEVEIDIDSMMKRICDGSADILIGMYALDSFSKHPHVFPLYSSELVAVVKWRAEVSTLEKIRHLWSTPVLMAAAFALALLFLVLMIKRWSFGSALLDLTRFLTYVSIQTDNRYQSFRIYFTTMLIFIVISNGVFQGKIAAFLTTREKGIAAESINELRKLGYQMYTVTGLFSAVRRDCPRCEVKNVSTPDVCIELVLNSTQNACLIPTVEYESGIQLSLDRVRKSLNPKLGGFKCRKNWPLRARFNDMIMRVVESGLTNYWEMKSTSIPKAKRKGMEAEWSSTQYRPVALMKLDFAFKLLAAGLSLATIVFFLELCWARYVNRMNRKSRN